MSQTLAFVVHENVHENGDITTECFARAFFFNNSMTHGSVVNQKKLEKIKVSAILRAYYNFSHVI